MGGLGRRGGLGKAARGKGLERGRVRNQNLRCTKIWNAQSIYAKADGLDTHHQKEP